MKPRDPNHCDNCRRGVPHVGERCPRCHRPAPRLDGIPCALCAPHGVDGVTMTDKNGITHLHRRGCEAYRYVDIATTKMKYFNVGDVQVTCLECIGTVTEPVAKFGMMVEYSAQDAEVTSRALEALR